MKTEVQGGAVDKSLYRSKSAEKANGKRKVVTSLISEITSESLPQVNDVSGCAVQLLARIVAPRKVQQGFGSRVTDDGSAKRKVELGIDTRSEII